MWSDNESDIDLLRFSYLSSSVKEIIRNPQLTPTTIGLFGDWGSGKSTIIKLLGKTLDSEEKVVTVSFNGWLFEDYEDAKTALMGSIIHALAEKKNLYQKCQDKVKHLLKRIDWFHGVLALGKYAVPALLGQPHLSFAADGVGALKKIVEETPNKLKEMNPDELKKFFKDAPPTAEEIRCSVQKFREDFQELIKLADIDQLVVFIDDLDRCLPDTIIDTLEAIRLFLFVPKTSFVIAVDERIVEYAVKNRFPELQDARIDVGRNYLEKMIQFPIRIPPLSNADVQSYMNLLFAQTDLDPSQFQKVKTHVEDFTSTQLGALSFDRKVAETILGSSISQHLQEDFGFVEAIAPSLAPGLGGSPRRTKRFLNTLLIRLDMGSKRGLNVNRSTLAKLMLLEYVRTEFFRELAKLQAYQDGFPKEIELLEQHTQIKSVADQKTNEQGEKKSAENEESIKNLSHWLSDEWMVNWLKTTPSLKAIDLKPYFYIAHDKVNDYLNVQEKLTPHVQSILAKLISSVDLTQRQGLNEAKALGSVDVIALFNALADRMRQAETLNKASPQDVLFNLMDSQSFLIPQLISLYGSFYESKVQLDTIPKFLAIAKNPSYKESVRSLLEKWKKNIANKGLAEAAKSQLENLK